MEPAAAARRLARHHWRAPRLAVSRLCTWLPSVRLLPQPPPGPPHCCLPPARDCDARRQTQQQHAPQSPCCPLRCQRRQLAEEFAVLHRPQAIALPNCGRATRALPPASPQRAGRRMAGLHPDRGPPKRRRTRQALVLSRRMAEPRFRGLSPRSGRPDRARAVANARVPAAPRRVAAHLRSQPRRVRRRAEQLHGHARAHVHNGAARKSGRQLRRPAASSADSIFPTGMTQCLAIQPDAGAHAGTQGRLLSHLRA
eukprot:scaffold3696_cov27-Tisochrysis_lutea.AAC.3